MAESEAEQLESILVTQLKTLSKVQFVIDQATPQLTVSLYPPAMPENMIQNIGGGGIQFRTSQEVEAVMPGVLKRMSAMAQGLRIAFYGNGLSTLPLQVADRFPQKSGIEPIIVDIFNYDDLLVDYHNLTKILGANKLKASLPWASSLIELTKRLNNHSLSSENYLFGNSRLPSRLHDISLAINCIGPPASTLEEQLQTLAPRGELWISPDVPRSIDPGRFSYRQLQGSRGPFSIITKR